ncbi:COX15/CtaA family protein [Pseudooceanicola sp. CBS1P-1]|uniref:Heme A synthase n=1 Tax=Pseudooceanicola albus TaxID=2692189 RepID=A0A6L7FZ54_9RHOB|nr:MULTISPECIES: heme A synthase [Pseudooceanicola]MBT9383280.1 COX15/CtaA family protein [Pseudooceanicola endophyticus]MXN16397.1 heme A synthase [Pseudooceanicola albus]
MSQKRSIFEDVSETQKPEIRTGAIDGARRGSRRAVRIWMALLFLMVVAMIALGGLTRLTDSGLSITQWKPLSGALPPMGQAAWQHEFDLYKQIPQFTEQNSWMQLSDFKQIYWWEWSHRNLGRAIGLVWALGFFGFWALGKIPQGWKGRCFGIGVLGAVQGAVGWWMVSSGLGGDMLRVASYRLAIHLGVAFTILGFIAWFVYALGREERDLMQARRAREKKLFGMSTGWMHMLFLQVLLGALTAGIDAGRSFTDWPLMGGQFFPPYAFDIQPIWHNFLENPGLVQFIHRCFGYLVFIYGTVCFLKGNRSPNAATRRAFMIAWISMLVQVLLGITTVMTAAMVHVAITHQLVAVLTFVLIIRARFMAAYPVVSGIRG